MLWTVPNSPRLRAEVALAWLARAAVVVVFGLAVVNWVGWAAGVEESTRPFPSWPHLMPWTALCLAMLGVAIVLQTGYPSRARVWAGCGLAVGVGVLAGVFLWGYATNSSFGLDEFWFSGSVRSLEGSWPGRPSPRGASSVLLLSIAVALLRIDRTGASVVRLLCLAAASVAPMVEAMAYLFGAISLRGTAGSTQIGIWASVSVQLLVAATLLARPDRNPVQWLLARPDRWILVRLAAIMAGLPIVVALSRVVFLALGMTANAAMALAIAVGTAVVGVAAFYFSQRELRLMLDREQLSDARAEVEFRYRILADNSVDIVSHLRDGEILWTSPSTEAAFGWPPEEWIGADFVSRTHPEDREVVVNALQELADGGSTLAKFRLVAADGVYHWVESHAKPYLDAAGNPDGVITSSRIIDDRVEAEQKLDRLAKFDTLTGLANRGETIARLESALSCSRNPGPELGVLFIDIDRFKTINDTLGHSVGDAALATLADRVRQCVRHGDTVGRTGGDEILVLLPGLRSLDEATTIAEKIQARTAEPIHNGGNTFHATLSIGVTLAIPGESVTATTARADAAMYQAKHRGGNTVISVSATEVGRNSADNLDRADTLADQL